jgi:hypothetical protein
MARVVAAAMASAACAGRRGGNGVWQAPPTAREEASESRLAGRARGGAFAAATRLPLHLNTPASPFMALD